MVLFYCKDMLFFLNGVFFFLKGYFLTSLKKNTYLCKVKSNVKKLLSL